jgi:hypothetical protein
MDHIVVGETRYASFLELGLLDAQVDPPTLPKKRNPKEWQPDAAAPPGPTSAGASIGY